MRLWQTIPATARNNPLNKATHHQGRNFAAHLTRISRSLFRWPPSSSPSMMNTTLSVRCHTEQHNQTLPLDERRRREERKLSTNLRGRHHWARASRRRSLPYVQLFPLQRAASWHRQEPGEGREAGLLEPSIEPGLISWKYAPGRAGLPPSSTRQLHLPRPRLQCHIRLHGSTVHGNGIFYPWAYIGNAAGLAMHTRRTPSNVDVWKWLPGPGQLWPRQSSDQWPDAICISARDVAVRGRRRRLARVRFRRRQPNARQRT